MMSRSLFKVKSHLTYTFITIPSLTDKTETSQCNFINCFFNIKKILFWLKRLVELCVRFNKNSPFKNHQESQGASILAAEVLVLLIPQCFPKTSVQESDLPGRLWHLLPGWREQAQQRPRWYWSEHSASSSCLPRSYWRKLQGSHPR